MCIYGWTSGMWDMRNDDSRLMVKALREFKHLFIIRPSIWYEDGETAVWGSGKTGPLKLHWDWLKDILYVFLSIKKNTSLADGINKLLMWKRCSAVAFWREDVCQAQNSSLQPFVIYCSYKASFKYLDCLFNKLFPLTVIYSIIAGIVYCMTFNCITKKVWEPLTVSRVIELFT